VLEQLGHAEKQRCRLLRRKRLADIQQIHDAREQRAALARLDGRLVERPRFLDHGRLVVVERCGV
jgi:hypothetical protein